MAPTPISPIRLLALAALVLALAGCATGPRYDTAGVDTGLTAARVSAAPDAHNGARIVWGGVIVTTRNMPDHSEMEILSYPLNGAQRPDTGSGDQGRFLARTSRYLEGVDYAPGRRITVSGRVDKTLEGKVGEAPYVFPLIRAEQMYLWPRDGDTPSSPQIHFGIGVIFSR